LATEVKSTDARAETIETVEEQQSFTVSEEDVLRMYARGVVISMWSADEWEYFDTIIEKESQWVHSGAHNPSLSSASGLGGFLDSTWSLVGCEKTDDRMEQLRCTALYIQKVYGSPRKAVEFHNRKGWY